MTPGILAAKKAGVQFTVHEYDHDPSAPSFGMEAAEKLNILLRQNQKASLMTTQKMKHMMKSQ